MRGKEKEREGKDMKGEERKEKGMKKGGERREREMEMYKYGRRKEDDWNEMRMRGKE